MIPLSLSRIAELTGGRVEPSDAGGIVVDGPVVTDSRACGPGGLYVARVGEHADGHDFVPGAATAGAVAALTSRVVAPLPCVVVPDVQEAFAALATGVVESVPGLVVIGVTGSSGKTTTKDLLAGVLSRHGETVATLGSLNSEVGVPLTVCRVTPTTRFLVVEMGARGLGHVRYLADMVHPSIGIVLNVGTAHVGEFGGRAAIARAKGELVEALPADGVAILNADDDLVAAMAGRARCAVVLTGSASHAQVRALEVTLEAGRPRFTLVVARDSASESAPVSLTVAGAHQVGNALAVAAAALSVGMSLDEVATALSDVGISSRYRMEITTRADGVTIVNDAYNANPESMAAALATLPQIAGTPPSGRAGRTRRTWALLGEMRELGEESLAEHERIGELVVAAGVDIVVVLEPVAGAIAAGVRRAAAAASTPGPELVAVADAAEAEALLRERLGNGDVALVKASNSIGLWSVADRLAKQEDPS